MEADTKAGRAVVTARAVAVDFTGKRGGAGLPIEAAETGFVATALAGAGLTAAGLAGTTGVGLGAGGVGMAIDLG